MKIVYLLILLILTSCGSRKVEITKQEKQVETNIVETKITTDSSNVEIKFNYELNTFTVEAKDNLKPFTYNGKTYFNVVLKQEHKKDNSLYRKDIKVVKNEAKQSNIKYKEVIKEKKVQRDSNIFKYYILLFILLLIILYYIYKKYIKIIL
jgi:hypothetical protein